MTREAQRRFEQEWPALAARLRYDLARRGLRFHHLEDVMQETAARLVSMWDKVDPARPLWPLTKTIALNLLRDESRRHLREVPTEIPDDVSYLDGESALVAHLELVRVREALQGLTAPMRSALLAEVGVEGAKENGGRDAAKMTRSRARKRLKEMLEELPALLPWRGNEGTRMFEVARELALPGLACVVCVGAYLPAATDAATAREVRVEAASVGVDGTFSTSATSGSWRVPLSSAARESRAVREAASSSAAAGGVGTSGKGSRQGAAGAATSTGSAGSGGSGGTTGGKQPGLPGAPLPEAALPGVPTHPPPRSAPNVGRAPAPAAPETVEAVEELATGATEQVEEVVVTVG